MTEQPKPDVVIPGALATIDAVWQDTLDPPRARAARVVAGRPSRSRRCRLGVRDAS